MPTRGTLPPRPPCACSFRRARLAVTFAQRSQGDVLLSYKRGLYLALKGRRPTILEIVAPTVSILAEPPVAVGRKNAGKNGATKSCPKPTSIPLHPRRPGNHRPKTLTARDKDVAARHAAEFPAINLFCIDSHGVFGGWTRPRPLALPTAAFSIKLPMVIAIEKSGGDAHLHRKRSVLPRFRTLDGDYTVLASRSSSSSYSPASS